MGFRFSLVQGLLIVLLLLGNPGVSQGDVLGTVTYDHEGGIAALGDTALYSLFCGRLIEGPFPRKMILDVALEAADSGSVFEVNMGNNSDWADIAVWFTDGDSTQYMTSRVVLTDGGVGTSDERIAPDFPGAMLNQITVTILDVQFESPGSDLNEDGIWTDFLVRTEVVFEGEYPVQTVSTTWGEVKGLFR